MEPGYNDFENQNFDAVVPKNNLVRIQVNNNNLTSIFLRNIETQKVIFLKY